MTDTAMADTKKNTVLYAAEDASRSPDAEGCLLLCLSDKMITAGILEKERQRFSYFKSMEVKDTGAALADENLLQTLLPENRPEKVFAFIDNRHTLVVPDPLFEEWMSSDLYKMHRRQDIMEKLVSAPMQRLQAHMVFGLPWAWERGLKNAFAGVQVYHLDIAWLELLLQSHKNEHDTFVHIDIDTKGLHIAVFRDSMLQIYNTFDAAKPEDWLYYILAVSEQLRVNPLRDPYYLSGNIDRGGRIYELFRNYIRDLRVEQRPGLYEYCMPMQEVPEQLYFKFYCTPVCVS